MHEHPPGSEHAGYRFPAERRHVLQSEERRQRMPPEPLLREAGINPGETVLDVGAGTGYWTVPLARMVGPAGKILAVDVEPIMLDEVRSAVSAEGLENVEILLSQDTAIPLPDGVADFAMLGFVLHEPASPSDLLTEVCRILKPEGRILVVDWQKRPTEQGPPVGPRIAHGDARSLLEGAGFRVKDIAPPTDEIYVLLGEAAPED